jgi:hypothetical protein
MLTFHLYILIAGILEISSAENKHIYLRGNLMHDDRSQSGRNLSRWSNILGTF